MNTQRKDALALFMTVIGGIIPPFTLVGWVWGIYVMARSPRWSLTQTIVAAAITPVLLVAVPGAWALRALGASGLHAPGYHGAAVTVSAIVASAIAAAWLALPLRDDTFSRVPRMR